jgi:hypothetical protein
MEKEGKKKEQNGENNPITELFNLASIDLLSLSISSLFEYMRCI